MKRKLVVFLLVLAMAISVASVSAFADNDGISAHASPTLTTINSFRIYSPYSSTYITINVTEDYIGFNHISTGSKVKACQGDTKACGADPGTIDGIWGQNSETALRAAQQTMHDYGYTVITSDGVCGPNTWRGFYSYCGGVPASVRNAVFNGV